MRPIPYIEDSDDELLDEDLDLSDEDGLSSLDCQENKEWEDILKSLDNDLDLNLLFDPSWK